MLTSKQRAYLRGLGTEVPAIMQIGKGGISENLIKTVSDALAARELIKLTVLETCEYSPKDTLAALAEATESEAVGSVGRKILLYRPSEDHKFIELPR